MSNDHVVPDGEFDVVIVGGGNAGIGAAARLIRKGITDVAVVEPQNVHTYRPLLSYVGAGQANLSTAERTQRSVTPKQCTWIQDSVVDVDTDSRIVLCESGKAYRYRDLVLGTGLVPDTDELPGVYEALDTPSVASNYVDRAEDTWQTVQAMHSGGHAIFTVPRAPVSCTGTTLKPLFLAADHWKRSGVRDVTITLVIDRPNLVGVPALDERIDARLQDLGVRVLRRTAVTALAPSDRSITVTTVDGATETLTYDMLHLVPPFRGPRWVTTSGLAGDDPHGVVDIDPLTFRHRTLPHVWAVGDGAAVNTDPSGGALRQQVSILVDNILASRSGKSTSEYDGYTVAPIAVGSHSLILGEFDRDGTVTSSLPSFLDPLAARRSAWAFDRYALPRMYWNLILKGLA